MSFAAATTPARVNKSVDPAKSKGSTFRDVHVATVPVIPSVSHRLMSSNTMTVKKRKQVQDIKAREDLRAARHRLRCILLQKLSNRYRKVRKSEIGKHIDEMLERNPKISANELADLEARIRELNDIAKQTESMTQKQRPEGTTQKRTEMSHENEMEQDAPISRVVKGHEWEMLQAYKFFEEEEKEKRLFAAKRQKELDAKRILDEQVAEKKLRLQQERQHEKEYLDGLVKELDKVQAKKDADARKMKEKNDMEKKLWEQQLEDERLRKRYQHDETIRREQELHELYLRSLTEESERIRRIKQLENEKQQKLIEANEKDKYTREELKRKEIENDNIMNQKYAEKLDREARDRENAFTLRMNKLAKFAEQIDNGPIMRAKREKEEREEHLRQQEMTARWEAAARKETNEASERRNGRLKMQQENQKIIENKKKQLELTRLHDKELSEKFMQESEENARLLREQRRIEKKARILYGQRLIRQMALDNSTKKEVDDMIERERRYNSENLRNIVDDTQIYDRICDKLRLSLTEKLKITISNSKSSREV